MRENERVRELVRERCRERMSEREGDRRTRWFEMVFELCKKELEGVELRPCVYALAGLARQASKNSRPMTTMVMIWVCGWAKF